MNRIIFTTASALTLTTAFAAPALAGPIGSLSECYAAVINWCESEFPNADCSQASGLDDCDEVFGDNSAGVIGFLQTRPGDGTARLILSRAPVDPAPRPGFGQGRDDTGRDNGRSEPTR